MSAYSPVKRAKKVVEKPYGSLFEEDYLVRTLGLIAHDHEEDLTEHVANQPRARWFDRVHLRHRPAYQQRRDHYPRREGGQASRIRQRTRHVP